MSCRFEYKCRIPTKIVLCEHSQVNTETFYRATKTIFLIDMLSSKPLFLFNIMNLGIVILFYYFMLYTVLRTIAYDYMYKDSLCQIGYLHF